MFGGGGGAEDGVDGWRIASIEGIVCLLGLPCSNIFGEICQLTWCGCSLWMGEPLKADEVQLDIAHMNRKGGKFLEVESRGD